MLSQRLSTIGNMIIKGGATADIGADHGLLTQYLAKNDIVPWVIASELNDGPYSRLLASLKDSPGRERIEIRQGDGLAVLKPGEVVNVVIAGMGGEAIAEIIVADYPKAMSFKRFVFQPMSKVEVLRKELCHRGWPILKEEIIDENGHLYVALSTTPGTMPYELSPLEIDLGPVLLHNKSQLGIHYLRQYLHKYRTAYIGISKSIGQENLVKLNDFQDKIKELEAILDGTS